MIQDVIPQDQQPELLDKLAQGHFTMRILYEQFANIQKMGPMSAVMSMIPGFGNDMVGRRRGRGGVEAYHVKLSEDACCVE